MSKQIILVVEDEKPLADAIKSKMESMDLDVVVARSVEQAMNYLSDISGIRGIWLDHYLLGKENGLKLVAKVKDDDSIYRNMPIFVVSNTASADKVKAYLQLGVDKYYTKSDHKLEDIISEFKQAL